MKMKRVNITIPGHQHAYLQKISKQINVPLSKMLRDAAEKEYGECPPPPVKKHKPREVATGG
jgi:hypothetical protein